MFKACCIKSRCVHFVSPIDSKDIFMRKNIIKTQLADLSNNVPKLTNQAVYYDQYIELTSALARLRQREVTKCSLEILCDQSPWEPQCKVFD